MNTDALSRRTVLQGLAAAALLPEALPAAAQSGRRLPRTTPAAAGIAPEGIVAFLDAVDAKVGGLHSFILLRGGKVAAEGWWAPYSPPRPHMLYSLSKSFTSTAVGLAIADGLVKLDDPVISFFPDKLPATVPDNLKAMRVRHLLSMSTGHDKDTTGPTTAAPDGDWVRQFLALPVEHAPGSKFVYNSTATYMCSAIVQKKTGKTVLDFLTPRLFNPLGIDHPTWETCPKGVNTGGWGLSVRTEDIARFGQLYLQKGQWQGKQLVPADWVAQATSKQVSNGAGDTSDWTQGYGYQFWRCRHNGYRGDGAFGQYCVVLPEQDAVLAITSGVGDMQAVLNAAWDHLLPAIHPAGGGESDASLKQKVASLTVPAPTGRASSPHAIRVSDRTIKLDANPEQLATATFTFADDSATLTLDGQKITVGHDSWKPGTIPAPAGPPRLGAPPAGPIAARGAWTSDDTYAFKVCYIETPYTEVYTCAFTGDSVKIDRKLNVAFGPTDRPALTGKLA